MSPWTRWCRHCLRNILITILDIWSSWHHFSQHRALSVTVGSRVTRVGVESRMGRVTALAISPGHDVGTQIDWFDFIVETHHDNFLGTLEAPGDNPGVSTVKNKLHQKFKYKTYPTVRQLSWTLIYRMRLSFISTAVLTQSIVKP